MSNIDMGKKVLVAGVGKSGIAAAKLLLGGGCSVVLYDDGKTVDDTSLTEMFGNGADVSMCTGSVPEEILSEIKYCVISPGIPLDAPSIRAFSEKGIHIIGEVELAYMYEKGTVAAITGTNGKTTTTALMGDIMKKTGRKVFVAGNIGLPYTETAKETDEESCSVLEVSSFQLETISSFRPFVSAVLNITPDHLNRHHTMDNYIKAKMDIAKNQTKDDVIVLNYEDEVLRKEAEHVNARVIYFSSRHTLDEGVYLEDGKNIVVKLDGGCRRLCGTDELHVLGIHSYENVMAAVAMARAMNVSYEDIYDAVTKFQSVEHRIEYVCEKNGVKYYNDSKATNTDAAIKGITSMVRPTYLIGGGYDKQADFTEWIQSFDGAVKKLVLIGETSGQIARTCDSLGFTDYIKMNGLKEAVGYCVENAESGDAVLLSPACASWDMFASYEERGKLFKKYVTQNYANII
ncbi:MAG: UDP-N-acetylmuramoyl-L-alanine--D-glutamate ligase [Lachnospiraceae bacterium]|nr:UDP-N-acetylmuramoyl-L-alanine--D-glutamate ligase [Lachnospiraceae bacterium]